jgi:hypothetical protein
MAKTKSLHNMHILAIIGAVQGILLFLAHELIARKVWPGTSLLFTTAWFTAIIGAPAAVQMLMVTPRDRRLWVYASGLSAVLLAVGVYFGTGIDPENTGSFYSDFIRTMIIGWFVALPFAAAWIKTGGFRFSYPDLFTYAWNNALTLAIAGLFTGTFWLLLWLWASLFKIVGIHFFSYLFTEPAFIYPVTGAVFGFAVSLGRTYEWAVVTVRNVVLSIHRGLFPLLAGIALLFLLALPFTGLQSLWNTGHAAALMMTLQFLFIAFLTATYQDGRGQPPYVIWLRYGIELTAITLPIYSLLSLYAIGLRVHQYGWSDDRVWATLVAVIIAGHAVGYAATALVRRRRWLPWLGQVNVVMAGVIIAVVLLTNSPVLDPKRIAVHSQMQRLLSGRIDADKFDYNYLRFEVGKRGVDGLTQLANLTEHPQAQIIRSHAKSALAARHRWDTNVASAPADVASRIDLLPEGKKLDPAFVAFLLKDKAFSNAYCYVRQRCIMLAVDLNRDGRDEYLLLESPHPLYSFQAGSWKRVGTMASSYQPYSSVDQLKKLLNAGEYKTLPSRWPTLQIGDNLYVVVEENR